MHCRASKSDQIRNKIRVQSLIASGRFWADETHTRARRMAKRDSAADSGSRVHRRMNMPCSEIITDCKIGDLHCIKNNKHADKSSLCFFLWSCCLSLRFESLCHVACSFSCLSAVASFLRSPPIGRRKSQSNAAYMCIRRCWPPK